MERKPLDVLQTDHFDCDACGVYVPLDSNGTCIRTPHHGNHKTPWFHLCSDCMTDLSKYCSKNYQVAGGGSG